MAEPRSRNMARDPLDADLEREIASLRTVAGVDSPATTPAAVDPAVEPLRARVAELVAAEKGWLANLRAMRTARRLGLVATVAALIALIMAVGTPRFDMGDYPRERMAITLAAFGALAGIAVWSVLRPLHKAAAPRWTVLAMLAASIVVPTALYYVPHHHEGFAQGSGAVFAERCGECLALGAGLALPMVLLTLAARRAAVGGWMIAALAGAAAALVGNVALQLHCAVVDTAHLLVGHFALVPLFVVTIAVWQTLRDRR
jgi:hypothetical protein